MKQLLIVLGVITVCCAFSPRTTPLSTRGTDEMVASYLQLKQSLVVSDSLSAGQQAKSLSAETDSLQAVLQPSTRCRTSRLRKPSMQ
ncbi:hypothetical protein [Paraflavitalea pollutisoli]|uniref:hypothetical protein n=1 Tax=Paraflavitalea pollutisoli TaxID=3034143 RepID=UPI0023EBC8AD|nr:hypothetical protein [Paraflavitalea sp. H1-2-19X]